MRIKTIQTSNKNYILKYFICRDGKRTNKNWDGGYLYYPFLHSTTVSYVIVSDPETPSTPSSKKMKSIAESCDESNPVPPIPSNTVEARELMNNSDPETPSTPPSKKIKSIAEAENINIAARELMLKRRENAYNSNTRYSIAIEVEDDKSSKFCPTKSKFWIKINKFELTMWPGW